MEFTFTSLNYKTVNHYVGISRNPEQRFRDHRWGRTLDFVKQNRPVKRLKFKLLETTDWKQAENEETNKTIELINQYGIENVSGGRILGDLKRRKRLFKKELENS